MTDTTHLSLPLLSPSQAQKHVTVNDALQRLDGMTQLRLVSVDQNDPPVTAQEGDCFGVASGAVNDWSGHDGEVAQYLGGGWVFAVPQAGWRAWVTDQGITAVHDGADWRMGAMSVASGGGGFGFRTVEETVTVTAGPSTTASLSFPSRSLILGVTGRVTDALTGAATSWELGDSSDQARFGAGLGMAQNSWISGPVAPFPVWSATPLVLTGAGGDLAGGSVRLAIHYAEFAIPDAG